MIEVKFFKLFMVRDARNNGPVIRGNIRAMFVDKGTAEGWAQSNYPNSWTVEEVLMDPRSFFSAVKLQP